MVAAKEEGLLAERQPNSGTVKQLEKFYEEIMANKMERIGGLNGAVIIT